MTSTTSSTPTNGMTDVLTQLSNVLPTGTCLAFQVLAPLATNNGDCGKTEIVVTSITLILLWVLCCVSCFTDSYKAPENGTVYYGIVTPKGLWNPKFRHAHIAGTNGGSIYTAGGTRYVLEVNDFVNATLSGVALATISMLTAPVTTCFYPNIPSSVQKSIPILVGLVVSVVCAFGTSPRSGIGFAMTYTSEPHDQKLLRSSSTASSPFCDEVRSPVTNRCHSGGVLKEARQ